MNDNTKENIIKYITGNKENDNYSTDLEYSQVDTITTNLGSQLASSLSQDYDVKEIISGRNINGNTLNYSLLYGSYTINTNKRGFVAIIDEVGNLIQVITKYSSNAYIGQIYTLNVDEEGNFYMLENNVENGNLRFVMLNNIVVKSSVDTNYKMQIRKAYAIPNTINLYNAIRDNIFNIKKAVGQSRYAIFYTLADEEEYLRPCVTELVINVGTSNEWNEWLGERTIIYIDPQSPEAFASIITGTYATWQDENINFIIMCQPNNFPRSVTKYFKSGNIIDYHNIDIIATSFTSAWGESSIILNDTTAYTTLSYLSQGSFSEFHTIYKIDLINDTSSKLYTGSGEYVVGITKNRMASFILDKVEDEILFVNSYCEDNSTNTYVCEVGRIRDDSEYYINQVSTFELTTIPNVTLNYFYIFFVNKQFNLYNINVMLDNNTYNTYQIFNRNNYNGTAFDNTKSLLPNSAILYNSDNKPIFARNLYNKIVSGGTTTSVVEVPYNYVNDIDIASQELLSYNNNVIIENSQTITTNIYEQLDINFINTLIMANENDINNTIINNNGASRLNNSISNILDYNNSLLDKIKIVYNDNSYEIKEVGNATYISQFVYQYNFIVYNPSTNSIKEIQLISHDENTTYQTIDFSNYTKNKIYIISQNIEIQ